MKLLNYQSIRLTSLLAFVFSISSCVKEIDEYDPSSNSNGTITDINQLQIPASFNFSNERNISVNITLKTNTDAPIPKVKIELLSDIKENNGITFYTGCTNSSGQLTTTIKVPRSLTELIVHTGYPGLPDNAVVSLNTNNVSLTLGGSNPQRFTSYEPEISSQPPAFALRSSSVPSKTYLGTWNTQGVPNYLSNPRDAIDALFLSRINQSLPENQPVPIYNPSYIAANNESNIEITETADVWMTFVHEGAGYRNSIGFYKYHKNNPPTTTADINNITIAFPNLSYTNSGGGLVSGDKIYLGTVGPDTMIGFILLANAYNTSNASVGNGVGQYYSTDDLNPESTPSKRSHNVILWDESEERMVIGFEDLNRNSGSDDDFNDAIFYITSNPATAINSQSALRTMGPVDADGDGVIDIDDDYPSDPDRAFNNYYPSDSTFGYLAFEDLWPYKGDYDLNDLLVGYRFNSVSNANNDILEVQSKIFVKAAGGSYQHGFGIALPVPNYFIESVNGPIYSENYINVNSNGTESGQNEAVVIVFDNSNSLAPRPGGYYVNTEPGSPVTISDTIRLSIHFVSAIPQSTLGTAPFNPFIISNKRRGYEIHLPDKPPTNLADPSLFNTGQDRSNIAMGRYYKTDNNLPWCINIPDHFPIITEKTSIIHAYLHFSDWAQSGGTLYPDWYLDLPGYRNENLLLNR